MRVVALLWVVMVAACTAAPAESSPPIAVSEAATVQPSPSIEPFPSAETPSPLPRESSTPAQLYGTWRTTLGGTPVTLTLRPDDTYRIHRGVSAGTGDIRIDGDRIDFFNSTLCQGTGEYRWQIEGDSLRFSSLTEPCPGRAEALLNVRYSDYSPPS
jgi:hypothetical protein